ncbi:MAG: hypothetical protein IT223_11635 [Crocinitomicaceae bacterium]|nr:hypothetical protein [Crocinitomicaceae bacterium]
MKFSLSLILGAFVLFASVLLFTACEESTSTHRSPSLNDSTAVSSSGTIKFHGEIISVPSPTQLASILEKAKVPFKSELLNPLANRTKYVNEQKKALNLGVYGADLAYMANYDKGQISADYFDAVGKLASDLQILENIDKNLVTRLSNNISKKDSLLALNALFFHAGDKYLKNAERDDLACLVLFGSWLEALYLSTGTAANNSEIWSRIGEQRHAAESLYNLLDKFEDPAIEPIKNEMEEVVDIFDTIKSSYEYRKPIHDEKNKKTYFNSRSSLTVTDEQMAGLTEHIARLRTLVIQ